MVETGRELHRIGWHATAQEDIWRRAKNARRQGIADYLPDRILS